MKNDDKKTEDPRKDLYDIAKEIALLLDQIDQVKGSSKQIKKNT